MSVSTSPLTPSKVMKFMVNLKKIDLLSMYNVYSAMLALKLVGQLAPRDVSFMSHIRRELDRRQAELTNAKANEAN